MTAAQRLDLRLPVNTDDEPFGYDDLDDTLAIEIALTGHGTATLLLPTNTARTWAGDLFGAVAVAYREATSDPHALTDDDLAGLPDPNAYQPATTLHLTGTSDQPAAMAFRIAVVIQGLSLDDAALRAALVTALRTDFNVAAVAVSHGTPADPRT